MSNIIRNGYHPAPREVADALETAIRVADFFPSPESLKRELKQPVTLRLDADVLRWFRRPGEGYQTRINMALRAYMQAASKKASKTGRTGPSMYPKKKIKATAKSNRSGKTRA